MESMNKSITSLSSLNSELLGAVDVENVSTVDLHYDPTAGLVLEKVKLSNLQSRVEDTQSGWANLRFTLNPSGGGWLSANNSALDLTLSGEEAHEKEELESTNTISVSDATDEVDLRTLLSEANSYFKEQLNSLKGQVTNISQFNYEALKNIDEKDKVSIEQISQISKRLDDSAWVIGSKLDRVDERIENFTTNFPIAHLDVQGPIIEALQVFEDKCLGLGATQLDAISKIQTVSGLSYIEEVQESLDYIVNSQKKVIDSISEILSGLKAVTLRVSDLPGYEAFDLLVDKQEDKIESIRLEMVESRIEDRGEDRSLRRTVTGLGVICLFTFMAILYSLTVSSF